MQIKLLKVRGTYCSDRKESEIRKKAQYFCLKILETYSYYLKLNSRIYDKVTKNQKKRIGLDFYNAYCPLLWIF